MYNINNFKNNIKKSCYNDILILKNMGIRGIHLNAISHIGKKEKNILLVLTTNIIYLLCVL